MKIAIKVRLLPEQEQSILLWKSAGTARWAYNWCLNKQIENFEQKKKFISDGILRKEITQLKKTEEYKWLTEISAQIPKQAIKDCCLAFKRFFKKQAKFPKFKSRKKSEPSFYNDNVKLEVKSDKILIEKVGWLQLAEKERIPLNVKYYNPRITNDGKFWYISVAIDKDEEKIDLIKGSLGIDMGVKDLAVCSNGIKFKNINKSKNVKKIKKRLKRFQRQVSRKYEKNKKGVSYQKTCNIIKIEKRIKLLHRKLKNIRNNYIHHVTFAIVKTKLSRIVIEDLNISGMMKNRHLSKAIAEQCFYRFKETLKYKCERYGIQLIEADKWFPSSKMCSSCGHIKKNLKLSDRIYICEHCGLVIDRDLNASINLEHYEVSATKSH